MATTTSSILVRFRRDNKGNLVARIAYRKMQDGREVFDAMEICVFLVLLRVDEVVRKNREIPVLFRYER